MVDAVPQSNMDYLQAAILGKDAKAKIDPAVQRASRRSQFRLWRLFGARDRDTAANVVNQDGLEPESLKFFLG